MTLFECYVERRHPQDVDQKWMPIWEWTAVDIDRVIAIGKGEAHDGEECAIFHLDSGQHLVIRQKYQETIDRLRIDKLIAIAKEKVK